VVLFWIWVVIALGVYAYRLFRRATQGPKAEREARAAAASGTEAAGSGVLSRFTKGPEVPLPEGPIEARLPESLKDLPPPLDAEGHLVIPTGGPSDVARAVTHPDDAAPGGVEPPAAPDLPPAHVTLAEALQGIRMPADLLPMVEPGEPGLADGRRARFGATGTNVPTVAVALGEELRRLGYTVDGLQTISSNRAGLTATRDTTAVAATVEIDDDTGAVVVQLNV
jgi:hypothetical protein